MPSRRDFLKAGAMVAGGLALHKFAPRARAYIPGGTLPPDAIPKYVTPMIIPPAMPISTAGQTDYYEIAVRQFQQQILPPGYPATTVWSYGSANHAGTFNYPAFTIEAGYNRPVRVKWLNELKHANGGYLPHLLPVDPTLHWANPGGGLTGRDMRPSFTSTPGAYRGPVPIVTHLHGGHSTQDSDGYPEAWFLPAASNIPAGFANVGSYYDQFAAEFAGKWGQSWDPGSAVFQYANDQDATTLWYHDHTLGMTRLNVYAGPAGFYLIRGGDRDMPAGYLPGPAPALGDAPGTKYYEIPIAIQDRSFNRNGSLFYPDSREFFDGATASNPGFIPDTDLSPIWNPEFFANMMVVNGRTWPYLEVEPRRYRLRLLNGCNSRFLILKLVTDPLASRPAAPALPFWQIGAEGGFLPAPVQLGQLLMGLAERADVIVDFTGLSVGTEIYMINEGPDEPFGGGVAETDFPASDPLTTGQVMKFKVVPLASADNSTPPARLRLPSFRNLVGPSTTRQVSLNEIGSAYWDGPAEATLGIMAGGTPVPLMWGDQITENPALNATEVWEMFNFTEDAHPIHIHMVQFQVQNRQVIGDKRRLAPEAWETGYKDTVISYPGQITRVKAKFDVPGLFVWHCHIVEHEDNEMMRPYIVG